MIAKDSCKIIELNQKQIISRCRTFTGKKKLICLMKVFAKEYMFLVSISHISASDHETQNVLAPVVMKTCMLPI